MQTHEGLHQAQLSSPSLSAPILSPSGPPQKVLAQTANSLLFFSLDRKRRMGTGQVSTELWAPRVGGWCGAEQELRCGVAQHSVAAWGRASRCLCIPPMGVFGCCAIGDIPEGRGWAVVWVGARGRGRVLTVLQPAVMGTNVKASERIAELLG